VHQLSSIVVNALSASAVRGRLCAGGRAVPCSLGRSGCRVVKREGDGATPIGAWRLIEVRYRADRLPRPRSALPVRPLRADDGWCDAVGDRNYNRPVRHPYQTSAEQLWRSDNVYDLLVVVAHNQRPRVHGLGSAIFIHLARPGMTPTAGCVALGVRDLRLLLARCGPRTRLVVRR
jgi:L,D-peptidoglycan transpeptidase YkuD (ErfK/YbiS/YcfS/YnhG family)